MKPSKFTLLLFIAVLLPIIIGVSIQTLDVPKMEARPTSVNMDQLIAEEEYRLALEEYNQTLRRRSEMGKVMTNGDTLPVPTPPSPPLTYISRHMEQPVEETVTLFGLSVSEFLMLIGGINGMALGWFQVVMGFKQSKSNNIKTS